MIKRTVVILAGLAVATSFALGQARAQSGLVPSPTRPSLRPTVIAAPSTCPGDPVLDSDGVVGGQDLIFPNDDAYYRINAKAGRSYSVEVWDIFDAPKAVPVLDVTTDCTNKISITDVTHADPDLSGGFAARVSWIQSSDQTLYIHLKNSDLANSYTYVIRVSDTTLFNPHWSTVDASKTQWTISNTTTSDVSGNFNVYDLTGHVLVTINNLLIPAGNTTLLDSRGVSLAYELSGNATFAYVGPPGAILANAYIEQNGRIPMVLPGMFVSKHSAK